MFRDCECEFTEQNNIKITDFREARSFKENAGIRGNMSVILTRLQPPISVQ